MARIVELKQYDNVTLCPGVMQNWVDLDVDGPSWKPLVAQLTRDLTGRVLVVGPHDPRLVADLAAQVEQVVVVVRAAQDAGTMAASVPSADVRAGNLADSLRDGETFDAVVMLDDLSRVLSAESIDLTWEQIAAQVFAAAEPGAPVLFAVENERGLHRHAAAIDAYARDLDRDWTPFRTWDASRPRTVAQLSDWLGRTGHGDAAVWSMFPTLRGINALTSTSSSTPQLRDLAAAYAARGWASPLPLRSAALADLMDDVAAGWIVCTTSPSLPQARTVAPDGSTRVWASVDDVLRTPDGIERRLPTAGRTLMAELIELAADVDTPGMRRLLRRWREAVDAATVDGVVAAEQADARLSNAYLDGAEVVFLESATAPTPYEDVVWGALADYLTTLQVHGLKHPWPTAMNRATRLASLGAMAGAAKPADLERWVTRVGDAGQSREELLAVVKRQQDELKSVWARWRWDEKQYATFVAKTNVQKGVRYAKKHGKNLPKEATKRVASKAKAQLKK